MRPARIERGDSLFYATAKTARMWACLFFMEPSKPSECGCALFLWQPQKPQTKIGLAVLYAPVALGIFLGIARFLAGGLTLDHRRFRQLYCGSYGALFGVKTPFGAIFRMVIVNFCTEIAPKMTRFEGCDSADKVKAIDRQPTGQLPGLLYVRVLRHLQRSNQRIPLVTAPGGVLGD